MTGKSGEKIKARFGQLFCGRSGGAAGVEVVEVEHGVEDEKIAAHCFAAPHRIVGEKNDVAFAVGNIHDGRLFGDLVAAGDHAAEEQIFFGGEAQNHTRLLVFRRNRKTGKVGQVFGNEELLLVRGAFHGLFGRVVSAALNYVGVAGGAAPAGTRGSACSFVGATAGTAEIAANSNDGTLAKIDVELIVVTVSDGAFLIVDGGEHDAAGGLHGAGVGNIDHFRHAAGDGQRSAALHSDEQAAITDKALHIGKALVAEAAANVVGGVEPGGDKVGSFIGVFPGAPITAHRQATQHGAQSRGTSATHWRKNDDVELFAEVLGFAQPGVGDVGVGDFQLFHGDAEPAVVLRVLPIVDEGDARG